MPQFEQLRFDNIYASLPPIFYSRHQPAALKNQHLIHFNKAVADLVGIDPSEAARDDLVQIVTMGQSVEGFDPIAMCYAGHQFGQYVSRLGDGRAVLLGQVINQQGVRWDLQLKGAGLTLYSRQGDGKAVLRSTIREHLCSAAMHGLGIPTTHSLAMFGSDEEVYREQIETGAMLIRVAPSHIRFGSFEYFFYAQRFDDLKVLADFTIEHYFPELQHAPDKYIQLLNAVIGSTAMLIAQWQSVGFCHGVMNSDNMSIHGITIDYGPFGFLDAYDPHHICNHSDYHGRYAFDQQPRIGLFNLSCLAQALLPLIDPVPEAAAEMATASLNTYEDQFDQAWLGLKRQKLGLTIPDKGDEQLFDALLQQMQQQQVDFTRCFRSLSAQGSEGCRDHFADREQFDHWAVQYTDRLNIESTDRETTKRRMLEVNPKYILRNYLAEKAIRLAEDERDFTEIDRLVELLRDPFSEQPSMDDYAALPPDWAQTLAVSCSS